MTPSDQADRARGIIEAFFAAGQREHDRLMQAEADRTPVMPCRECDGTGVSRFGASLICGVCDGTREDPSSPVWQVTS